MRRLAAASRADVSAPAHKPKLHKSISPARQKARADGIRAERAAADYLVAHGFVVLDSNLRIGRYEIDVLALDGNIVVIVEVRTRGPGALVRALDSIDAHKRARLRLAGRWLWRDRYAMDPRFERLRFDCIAVRFDEEDAAQIEHVRAAF